MEARDKRAAEQGKGKIMRNSFVLYTEYAKQISLLTMEQRGQLLTAIIQYVTDDTVPELDAVTEMAFSIIQDVYKRQVLRSTKQNLFRHYQVREIVLIIPSRFYLQMLVLF